MCHAWLRSVQTFVTTASFFFAGSAAYRCGARKAAPAEPRKVRRESMMHLVWESADCNRGGEPVQQPHSHEEHRCSPRNHAGATSRRSKAGPISTRPPKESRRPWSERHFSSTFAT